MIIPGASRTRRGRGVHTANPRTNIVEFRGFDSSFMLLLRAGILMSIGDFPESLSRAMLGWLRLGWLKIH